MTASLQDAETGAVVECERLQGRAFGERDRPVVSVPRSCAVNPRSVRFGGVTVGLGSSEDPEGQFRIDDARRDGEVRQRVTVGTRDLFRNRRPQSA